MPRAEVYRRRGVKLGPQLRVSAGPAFTIVRCKTGTCISRSQVYTCGRVNAGPGERVAAQRAQRFSQFYARSIKAAVPALC
jgi:hypothetical protein